MQTAAPHSDMYKVSLQWTVREVRHAQDFITWVLHFLGHVGSEHETITSTV